MSAQRNHEISHLFLSYGRQDATDLAERLSADLEAAGFHVWRDVGEIRSGRWEEQIEAAIRQSDAVVAVLSPHSTRPDSVCLDEISFARYAAPPRPIFPLMAAPCALPLPIVRLHYIDICGWQTADAIYASGLSQLIESLRASQAPQHVVPTAAWSLPRPLTRFLGRTRELTALTTLLAEAEVPLVTIVGIGGIGKTRLALALAEEVAGRFEDGVCFVSAESTGDDLFALLARALQLEIRPTPGVREQVVHFLSTRAMLLILDGVEELSRAVNDITELALRAPGLRIVATSRRLLGIEGEHNFPLPPLDTPDSSVVESEASLRFPAVALFCERARAASSFQLSASNLEAVTAICRHLDGHPLSIELAAACTRGMSVREIEVGLADRFSLLVSRRGAASPRQRALRDVIAWACQMLDPEVQRFFASLGIFRGGFSLAAVQAIFSAQDGALDALFQLIDHALVTARVQGEFTRYEFPESVAEYARQQMHDLDLEGLREAHARYYVGLLENAVTHLHAADEAMTLQALERDLDNCRAALKGVGGPLLARGAAAGSRMLVALRLWPEALELARVAVEVARERPVQWAAWFALADALASLGRHDEALTAAVESGTRADDPTHLGRSLNLEGVILQMQGRRADARERFERALRCSTATDEARVLHNVAFLDFIEGDVNSAETRYREVIALRRRYHDQSGLAETLNNLGDLLRARDHLDAARACYEESAQLWRDLGDRHGSAISRHNLGELLFLQGHLSQAKAELTAALTAFEALGSPYAEESRKLLLRIPAPQQSD